MRLRLVVGNQRFETPCWSCLQEPIIGLFLPLKMGPVVCPEMFVANHKPTLRHIPEKRRSNFTCTFAFNHHELWDAWSVGVVPALMCLCCLPTLRLLGARLPGSDPETSGPACKHWRMPWLQSGTALSYTTRLQTARKAARSRYRWTEHRRRWRAGPPRPGWWSRGW